MPVFNDSIRERLFRRAKSIHEVLGSPWQNQMNVSKQHLELEVETAEALKMEIDAYIDSCKAEMKKAEPNG